MTKKPESQPGNAAKLFALIRKLEAHRAEVAADVEVLEATAREPDPEPYDEHAGHRRHAQAVARDAIHGTEEADKVHQALEAEEAQHATDRAALTKRKAAAAKALPRKRHLLDELGIQIEEADTLMREEIRRRGENMLKEALLQYHDLAKALICAMVEIEAVTTLCRETDHLPANRRPHGFVMRLTVPSGVSREGLPGNVHSDHGEYFMTFNRADSSSLVYPRWQELRREITGEAA